jgi:hypothetical protein
VLRVALSVDLDDLDQYVDLHGLTLGGPVSVDARPEDPRASAASRYPAYDRALERIEALASSLDAKVTFFAIGRDLGRLESAERLRALAERGHAVESHSFGHDYALTRRERHAIELDLERARLAVRLAVGVTPTGFRAPGYTMTARLAAAVREVGHTWDSSVFPCPPYGLAKLAVLAGYAVTGRESASIAGSPEAWLAPTEPYRMGSRPGSRGRGLVELPIAVWSPLRLPVIGTSLALAGPTLARRLARRWSSSLFNLELHALDFWDAEADGLGELAAHEPALRVPLARRLETFHALGEALRARGAAFVRLDEVAREVS